MSWMNLPEDLNFIGFELQDQKNLLSNHQPVLPLFYTHSLATPSNHRWSPEWGWANFPWLLHSYGPFRGNYLGNTQIK